MTSPLHQIPTPLAKEHAAQFAQVKFIISDFDDTMTTEGLLTSEVIDAVSKLKKAGIEVLIATGRNAAWVSCLSHILPVVGALGETGGVYFSSRQEKPDIFIDEPALVREKLKKIFLILKAAFPYIEETTDNSWRLADWTFERPGISLEDLNKMKVLCLENAVDFQYSTVHCHIFPQGQNKAAGVLKILGKFNFKAEDLKNGRIVTMGDSPNDSVLFDPAFCSLSVGVKNVLKSSMEHMPRYVTANAEGKGFAEFADYLLNITSS